jgi:LPS O-antigen subunit length determinant protein (WzzB/FepE family)
MQHLIEVSEKFSNIEFDSNDKMLIDSNRGFTSPNLHRLFILWDREKVELDEEFIREIQYSSNSRQDWEDFDQYKKRMKLKSVLKQHYKRFIKYFLNS